MLVESRVQLSETVEYFYIGEGDKLGHEGGTAANTGTPQAVYTE